MSGITWSPVAFDEQTGTTASGTFSIEAPDAGGRVRVRYQPNLPTGLDAKSVNQEVLSATVWTEETNRFSAMNPVMGSRVAYFHDREAARFHIEAMLDTPVDAAQSVDAILADAGFTINSTVTRINGSTTFYERIVGTSTFTLARRSTGLDLTVLRTRSPSRWRTLAVLERPAAQKNPAASVGIWPEGTETEAAHAAAIVRITNWAIEQNLLGAPRRQARDRAA